MKRVSVLVTEQQYEIIDAVCDLTRVDKDDLLKRIVSDHCLHTIDSTPELTHLYPALYKLFHHDNVSETSTT